jgi:hypothetical protein
MSPFVLALLIAVALVVLGCFSGYAQLRGLRQLGERKHVPSDELHYLRNRYRRRLVTAGLLLVIGLLLGTAYVSGMEAMADALGNAKAQPAQPLDENGKPIMSDEQRLFVRVWGFYWMGILVLVFALVGLAMVDAIATRRYWLGIYRELREEHQVKLRRDLAVYHQQKDQNRAGPGRLGPVTDVED